MSGISKRNPDFWIPIFLFVINFIPALLLINEGLFHMDAVVLAEAVEKTYQTGVLQQAVLGRMGAVLVNSILYLPFYWAGQNADFVTRFSSVLFQSLSAVAAYLFIKELLKDRMSAIFAALLFSFTPFYFVPNTYGKEHGMSMFFMLMSFWSLLRGLVRQRPQEAALASALFVLAVSIRESILLMLPVYFLLYCLPIKGLLPESIPYSSRYAGRMLAALLLPLTAGLVFLGQTYLVSALATITVKQGGGIYKFMGIISRKTGYAFIDAVVCVSPVIMVAVIAALFLMWVSGEWALLALLLAWAGQFFLSANTNFYSPRHLDTAIVASHVMAGYSLGWLFRRCRLVAIGIVLTAMASMWSLMYPMLDFRRAYNGEKRTALFVKALTEPDAVVITQDQSVFVDYYGRRTPLWIPLDDPEGMERFFQDVRMLLQRGTPVYYTFSPYLPREAQLVPIAERFQYRQIGEVLSEDYHRPEISFRTHLQKLYRILAPKS